MTVAPLGWALAGIAGLVTALVASRGLRGGRRGASLAAAAARGLAVALAVVAAFGPVTREPVPVSGETLVAAAAGADVGRADMLVRWPADASDAASALETLRAARDAGSPASLVLAAGADIGRGRDVGPAARALRADDAIEPSVLALPAPEAARPLRSAPRIICPAGAVEGVPVALTIASDEGPFQAGEARVEVDGRVVVVPLSEGAGRVSTPPLELAAGTHVVVAQAPGRLPAAAIVDVAGPPRVLFVSADAATRDVVAMLRTQGLDVSDVRAADLRADDVDRCAAIVLGPGVTGEALGAAVASRVRAGAGLLVVGGHGTQGISRFRGGPLDAALPVVPPEPPTPPPPKPVPPPPVKKPDPAKPKSALDEGDKKALRVALLLVIDTSGSMAGGKLRMAQSAVAAAATLSPADRVAVISFDEEFYEVAPFQDAVEMQALYRRIGGLHAQGGTNFFPALKAGYREILKQPCGIRHVILLTDGDSRPGTFDDIAAGVAAGVTLSTVAVGEDADRNELALMATCGHGQMHRADDPNRLPEIVTLDTRTFTTEPRDKIKRDRLKAEAENLPEPPSDAPPSTRQPLARDARPDDGSPPETPPQRRPHVASSAALLSGIENAEWPTMPFAETTPARPASQVVLAWDDRSPALTLGRAGVGRVAVISAGAVSAEARDLRRWPEAPQFLAQLVRGLVEPPARGVEPVEAQFVEADDGRAFVRVPVGGGGVLGLDPLRVGTSTSARCADRGAFSIAELAAMPPAGVYAGTFAAGGVTRRAVAVSPGPRGLAPDTARRVVAATSGAPLVERLPTPPEGAPEHRDEPNELPFVVGAAGLLVVEAALRRIARSTA